MSDQPAYTVSVAQLASQIPAAVTLSPQALAFFQDSIAAADALRAGADIESASVLDEVLRVGGVCMPSVLAGKVTGYGPLRMRYTCNLATTLAGKVAELDAYRTEAAGAGTAKTVSLRGTRGLQTRAVRALKSLAGRRPEEKARLANARRGAEKPDERARALGALAKELKDAVDKVPPEVAADAGATQALIDELHQASSAVLGSRGNAQDARAALASLYDDMNILDGRLLHELRLLVGAMTDARREDKTVPAVKSPLLKSGKRKKKSGGDEGAGGGGGGAPGTG